MSRVTYRELNVGDVFSVISPRTEVTKSGSSVKNDGVYVKEGNSHCTNIFTKKDAILPLGARCSIIFSAKEQ